MRERERGAESERGTYTDRRSALVIIGVLV